MRLDYTQYNVMLDKYEEGFIGYVKDMKKLYKDYVKQLCEDDMYDVNMIEVIKLLEELERYNKDWLVRVDYPYIEYIIKLISKEV